MAWFAAAHAAELTMDAWLQAFLDADPSLREAELRVAAAEHSAEGALNRQQTVLLASPRVGGGVAIVGDTAGGFGTGSETALGIQRTGPAGRSVTATVSGSVREPELLQGPSAAAQVAGRIPLRDNAAGKLWALEARVAALQSEGQAWTSEAVRRERCFLGSELFVVAAALQDQTDVYGDFVEVKEASVARTERDVRRGMLRPLELLTARTDLSQTTTDQLALAQRRDEARAVLAAWLPEVPERLAPPELEGWTDGVLDEQPSVQALLSSAESRAADAEATLRRYQGRVDLVPDAYAAVQTGLLDTTGAPVSASEVGAGVAVEVEVPLRVPRRDHEVAALQAAERADRAAADEARRAFSEQRLRAEAAIVGLKGRAEALDARLELAQEQVDAAWQEFLAGRIEYQDWAQHYALLQSTRLERVQLDLDVQLATLTVARATAALPAACEVR